ncbi:hypothetical protein [Bradyrhizobium sp. McL0616]|uniref:hypothetical protein n=1 Tax=Bradyrhizobium sp. McL0616 TaxID=3415674 RepID=UPI003CEFA719
MAYFEFRAHKSPHAGTVFPTAANTTHCPACAQVLRLMSSMLDVKSDRTVRLYQCDKCGERIWED